jgi:RNA polymerase sigma-70 factor (ECF subfamily)
VDIVVGLKDLACGRKVCCHKIPPLYTSFVMHPAGDDWELLSRYARQRDEPAFASIVSRYVNLVYSAAARRVGDRHLAEDITQAVFVILARKAQSIRRDQPLSNWLLTTVRYAAANAVKMENRRRKHELAAATRNAISVGACSTNPSDVILWQEVASQLDDALLKLSAPDRTALLLRYFEDRPISDIAKALTLNETAARQRLSRAIEKLRQRLHRRGVGVESISAGAFTELLASHAVRIAPAGLSHAACAAATAGTVAGTTASITIAKGAIHMMTLSKIKIAAAVLAAVTLSGVLTVSSMKTARAADDPAPAAAQPAADEQKNDDEVSLKNAPPVVVKTVPESGSATVDPSIKEIRVTYSKVMMDKTWSWSSWGEEHYPKTTGKPHYEAEKRTCILPVKLEPGKTYAMWLNSQNFGNFKDADGHSAVPYLLVFQTKK